jgi:lipopolysaccharide biosynthesis protein
MTGLARAFHVKQREKSNSNAADGRSLAEPRDSIASPRFGLDRKTDIEPSNDKVDGGSEPWARGTSNQPTQPDLFTLRLMTPTSRMAFIVEFRKSDLWTQLRSACSQLSERFDIFLILTGDASRLATGIQKELAAIRVLPFANHNVDAAPFLTLINCGVLFKYELVCRLDMDATASESSAENVLVRSAREAEEVAAAFDADPDLGIVVRQDGPETSDANWHRNPPWIDGLCARIGMIPVEAARIPRRTVYWVRPFLLRLISSLAISNQHLSSLPTGHYEKTGLIERLLGMLAADAGMRIADLSEIEPEKPTAAQCIPRSHLIAFYLPQFHPVPENDLWWGQGFTEWTNVTRAKPLFPGHRQPRLPADLGYYDLRMQEARTAQAELAGQYGISAFCYYYYWFDGRRLLERPLDDMLRSGKPDFPFLLCWANEPWSRGWGGKTREVLVPQDYKPGWPHGLAQDLAPVMQDKRYFRYCGDPILLVYRAMNVPDRVIAFKALRTALAECGIPKVHLAASWPSFSGDEPLPHDPTFLGLDAYFEFQPRGLSKSCREIKPPEPSDLAGRVYDYNDAIEKALKLLDEPVPGVRHRGVSVGWDNTPRRNSEGVVFYGATPANFRRWLRGVIRNESNCPGPVERLVFINAWNEWAEGAYLEPDQTFGRGWLEAVKSAAVSS